MSELKRVQPALDNHVCPVCDYESHGKIEINGPLGSDFVEHKITIHVHSEHEKDEFGYIDGCVEVVERFRC